MAGINRRKCCCVTGCAGLCDFTNATCPNARVVFAGTVINCCRQFNAAATTFDGTYILTGSGGGCTWVYSVPPGVSDDLNVKRWNDVSCTSSLQGDHLGYAFNLSFQTSASGAVIRLFALNGAFAGEVAVGACSHGPITINNGTSTDTSLPPCNSIGSATVTFCV